MRYRYVLFDLDGTLTDSREGIAKSVEYSLKDFGIKVDRLEDLYKFIGPPLRGSYKEFYNFDAETAERAIKKYRERYSTIGLFECTVYDGIIGILELLKGQGRKIILATSKPLIFAEKIIERKGLARYFDLAVGCELDGTRENKSEIVAYVLEKAGITDPSEAVMIGDRNYDVYGASANGVDTVGVLFGFGSEEELRKAGAKYIVKTTAELEELFKSQA